MLLAKKIDLKPRLIPFTLSLGIILLDQVSKLLVSCLVPSGRVISVIGDFFRIIKVQNPAIAFSIGSNLAAGTQKALFGFLPLAVIAVLILYYLFTRDELTGLQKWSFAAVIGGGLGNYVDRILRPGGVLDFLDFNFYGIFGLERWPTFNLADSTVVVAGILLLASFLLPARQKTGETK